jgi:hypothetical protein
MMLLLLLGGLSACEKTSDVLIPGNRQPDYSGITTIRVENYINRLFIDLLGREATDTERNAALEELRNAALSVQSRVILIQRLQKDSTFREGDSSYRHAYYERIYNLMKARFLEGADDGELRQNLGNARFAETVARLNGDSVGVYAAKEQILRYENVLNSRRNYRIGHITFSEMCSYMMNNGIYDIINMNSFNFVNASYDDLFNRLPTRHEFDAAYEVIEYNRPAAILGRICTNKLEYCKALTESSEFFEAQVRWAYFTLVQREPTAPELQAVLPDYRNSGNLQQVQLHILKTDEYAQFR